MNADQCIKLAELLEAVADQRDAGPAPVAAEKTASEALPTKTASEALSERYTRSTGEALPEALRVQLDDNADLRSVIEKIAGSDDPADSLGDAVGGANASAPERTKKASAEQAYARFGNFLTGRSP
jgi:hypothetical protein